MESVKCLIIGSGPAGFTAAIYAARASLAPVLYEGIEPGGQLTTTTEIENFPGYPEGITGKAMMDDLRRQAVRFGTDVRTGIIGNIDTSKRPFVVTVDNGEQIEAQTVIIATGASAKYLGLPSEQKYKGLGVSACATCDGFFYRKQDVAVVGGGDTACEEATYLASLCRQVYLIVRKPFLRASKAMQERVFNTPNIKVLFEHNTAEVLGDEDGVTGVRLRKSDGEEYEIPLSASSLLLVTIQIPSLLQVSSPLMSRDISSLLPAHQRPLARVSLLRAMCATHTTVRQLLLLALVVLQHLMQSVFFRRISNDKGYGVRSCIGKADRKQPPLSAGSKCERAVLPC